jgi:arylsulfatase A-like enzyme
MALSRPRPLTAVLCLLAALLLLAWLNRLTVLQYTLGWHTDWHHPRAPNRPVPWMAGPEVAARPPAGRPPNIVVILADDLGINDVGHLAEGATASGVPTPAIDALAREGVRFAQGHAAAPVCTVSRAALLTGRYPWRFGVEFTPTPGAMARVAGALYADASRLHPVHVDHALARTVPDFNELGMPGSETTLAELLKAQGYHTLHIGKWHLGSTAAMRPNAQGFDETLFMESGLYLPRDHPQVVNSVQDFDPIDRFLWPNMRYGVSYNGGDWFEPARYLTDYFTDEAVNAIRANRHRPFLLYLAHWGVHTPLQAAREDYEALAHIPDHRRRVYGAMVRALDRSVARVMQALREQGLDENTLVLFTSDNGAPGYVGLPELNRPYRGWKLTMFQGGLRVPYVARWPARLPAGRVLDAPMHGIDILPTLAAAAGAPLPGGARIDGLNLLPHLAAGAPLPPARALHWRDGPYRAVQEGGWKLIVSARPARQWLFHLATDPHERRDLAGAEPQQLARLQALMKAHHDGAAPPLWPSFIELPVAIDKTLDQPLLADDEVAYWFN